MNRLIFVVCMFALLLAASPLLAQEPEKPEEPAGNAVKWESDFSGALEKAKKDDSMIMVYIYVAGSSMAADFEKYAINQPAVVELSKKFICVKIEKNKDKDVVKKLHASKATRVLFITSEQKRLGEVRGYEDPGPFAKKVKDVYESIAIEKKARETLQKDSEDLEANLQLAKVWVIRSYQDQAMALFQKVVDGDARNKKGFLVEAAFRLGHLQFESGQFKQARDNFKKVKKHDVMDKKGYGDDILLAEARMDARERNYKEGLKKFRLFTVKYSESELMHNALFYMGGAYYESGDDKKAVETWEKLLKDHPDSRWVDRAKDFIRQLKQPKK